MRLKTGPKNALSIESVDLYNSTSSKPMRSGWHNIQASLIPYLQYVYFAVNEAADFDCFGDNYELPGATDDGTCWIAFSGGKDCMAAAIKARKAGFNPVLYHLHGINRAWPDELTWAENAAAALKMPLVVDRVAISGKKNGFIEMPTKNQVITGLMVANMIDSGGAFYSLGVTRYETADKVIPDLTLSDGTEAVRLYSDHLSELRSGTKFIALLEHESESVGVVARAGMLEFSHSCMAPMRFRNQYRNRNIAKFGPLLPGRCGSCTKCASEALNLWAIGHPAVNEGLWEHSKAVMMRIMPTEYPDRIGDDPMDVYCYAPEVAKSNKSPERVYGYPKHPVRHIYRGEYIYE